MATTPSARGPERSAHRAPGPGTPKPDTPRSSAARALDLHLDLPGRGPGVRAALEEALRGAVRSGRLARGSLLPSSRVLARDLGLARNTVAGAYEQLAAEGWLVARQGSGTRVSGHVPVEATAPPGVGAPARHSPSPYAMTAGSPDLSAFPRRAWLAAAQRAMVTAPRDALGYGDPRGCAELRQALVEYLARTRGVRTTPDRVVVCSGSVQGLSVLGRTWRRLGIDTVAVENMGFHVQRDALTAAGAVTVPLPLDADGARVDRLGGSGAHAAVLTPAHQFPTGVTLAPPRRAAAVAWARETEGLLVEDDYDGEFRYDGRPVGALQARAPEHVVYLGSVSKTLAPGLRLGWMVLPPAWVDPVVETRYATDIHTGVFEQLTLAEMLRSGDYDRHVRRARHRYRQRRDALVQRLAVTVPQVRARGVAAGLHALLDLPGGPDEEAAVVARANRHGLGLFGLGPFRYAPGPDDGAGLVVGYGATAGHAWAGALDRLTEVLREAVSEDGPGSRAVSEDGPGSRAVSEDGPGSGAVPPSAGAPQVGGGARPAPTPPAQRTSAST